MKLSESYYRALKAKDLPALGALYTEDAEVIRYDGCAKGREEIQEFFKDWIAKYGRIELRSIDDMRQVDDVALWDATVDTKLGLLQTYDVALLGPNGLIRRHVPSVRGFWGTP